MITTVGEINKQAVRDCLKLIYELRGYDDVKVFEQEEKAK